MLLASFLIDSSFSFCSFKADVLSEEAILKWYNDAHLAKGKSVFLEQMKKFVEWLKFAEEGKVLQCVGFSVFSFRRSTSHSWRQWFVLYLKEVM